MHRRYGSDRPESGPLPDLPHQQVESLRHSVSSAIKKPGSMTREYAKWRLFYLAISMALSNVLKERWWDFMERRFLVSFFFLLLHLMPYAISEQSTQTASASHWTTISTTCCRGMARCGRTRTRIQEKSTSRLCPQCAPWPVCIYWWKGSLPLSKIDAFDFVIETRPVRVSDTSFFSLIPRFLQEPTNVRVSRSNTSPTSLPPPTMPRLPTPSTPATTMAQCSCGSIIHEHWWGVIHFVAALLVVILFFWRYNRNLKIHEYRGLKELSLWNFFSALSSQRWLRTPGPRARRTLWRYIILLKRKKWQTLI